jgi:hypothetical protein
MNALSVIVIDLAHLVVKIVAEAILQVLLKIMTITDEAPLAAIAHGAKITVAAARNASTTAAATIALPVGLPAVPLTMAMVHPANATEKTRTAAAHHHAVGLVSMTIRMRTGAAMVMEAADLHMKDSHLALADLLQDVLLTMAAMIGLGTGEYTPSSTPPFSYPLDDPGVWRERIARSRIDMNLSYPGREITDFASTNDRKTWHF